MPLLKHALGTPAALAYSFRVVGNVTLLTIEAASGLEFFSHLPA